MAFSFHPEIDWSGVQKAFATDGIARIQPFLSEEIAEELRRSIVGSDDWNQVFNLGGKVYEVGPEGQSAIDKVIRGQLDEQIGRSAREGFQYRYDSLRVADDPEERAKANDLLNRFAEFMASEPTLAHLGAVLGLPNINFADAQATIYRAGDFLTAHHDLVEGKGREAAYVFNLSPVWRADWGGLLLFHDAAGNIERGLTPQFNSLNLFRVPRNHSVSQVASFVTEPRISITGWLRRI